MKVYTSITLASILVVQTAKAFPQHHQSSAEQDIHWKFALYQNERCSGQATIFSGNESVSCQRHNILNGGAVGYMKIAVGPQCIIPSFENDDCTDEGVCLWHVTGTGCQARRNIESFNVTCDVL
ncbi:hypothetical protein MW887_010481 [Aspergillus wentii]|nr:hypothetical protein MW887_010481 [Aspergillus wentii]